MPAIALTAAEIAAAEAAAIAAAEAAAVHAAQVAAAQAAQVAAAEAATQAAAQAATQAATQATTSGIQTLAQEVATAPPAGIEQLTQAFQQAQTSNVPMSQAEFLNQSFAGPAVDTGSQLSQLIPATPSVPPTAPPAVPVAPTLPAVPTVPAAAPPLDYGFSRPDMGGAGGMQQGFGGTGMQAQLTPEQLAGPNPYSVTQGLNYQSPISASVNTPPTPAPSGIESLFNKGLDYAQKNPLTTLMGANTAYNALNKPEPEEKKKYKSTFKSNLYSGYTPVQPTPYQPQYALGGPVEAMSDANAVGANTGYPMANIQPGAYATPYQQPIPRNVIADSADTGVNPMTGEMQFVRGGLADLGGYSDGGRMLKGPGDGMSDDIPATIAGKQPARLANEEFVIPADVVSHLGNGSSEAGAKQLYKMMDRIRKARTGTKKQGKQINPEKYLA